LKILIIGLGSIGKKHVDAILILYPEAQIYALRTNSNSEDYKDVKNIYSKNEIPPNLDFIIISNITSSHGDTILDMLHYGCPLFIEKPVISDLKNADEIFHQLTKTGIKTYVACNMRFHPSIEFIKNYFKAENLRVNEVNIYSGSFMPDWRPGKDFRKIYSANKEMGGGVHLDLIHEMDYCCWIFGYPEYSKSLYLNRSSLEINAIDSARYLLVYPDFSASISLNYFRRDAKRLIEIITTDDTIVIDLLKNTVISNIRNMVLFESEFKIIDTYTKQIRYFINQIKSSSEPMNNFENAIKVLKLAVNE
jgi:predicted dehydrogenase